MTTALATRDTRAIEPRDFGEAFRMAEVLFNSRMFPKSCPSPEAAMVILLKGRELGISTVQAMTEIHVIEGKVSLSASLMGGLVLSCGAADYFSCVESSAEAATYATRRKGDPTGEHRLTFTMADASRAGLTGKDNWKRHPADMLRARAASKLARMVYPDVLAGCYTPDEIEDFDRPSAQAAAPPAIPPVQANAAPALPPVPSLPPPSAMPKGDEMAAISVWLVRIQEAESKAALDAVKAEMNAALKRRTKAQTEAIKAALAQRTMELAEETTEAVIKEGEAEHNALLAVRDALSAERLDEIRAQVAQSALTDEQKRVIFAAIQERRQALAEG